MSTNEPDLINHPPHYTASGIEPIDVIEAWKLGYHLGNVVKYLARHRHKGTPLKDLKKARWYLDRKIQRMAKAEAKEPELQTVEEAKRFIESVNGRRPTWHVTTYAENAIWHAEQKTQGTPAYARVQQAKRLILGEGTTK